jgi:hypothetical protein
LGMTQNFMKRQLKQSQTESSRKRDQGAALAGMHERQPPLT